MKTLWNFDAIPFTHTHCVGRLKSQLALQVFTLIALLFLFQPKTAISNETLSSATANNQTVNVERILDGVIEAVNQGTVSSQTSGRVTEIN